MQAATRRDSDGFTSPLEGGKVAAKTNPTETA